jgi:hypothetical protein
MARTNGLLVLCVALLAGPAACSSQGSTNNGGGGGGGGGSCGTTNLVASPNLEACFQCMQTRCCALLQACDGDAKCVYCSSTAGQTDTDRCIDGTTFTQYAPSAALTACQTQNCIPPCGIPGGGGCTPSNCVSTCSNFSTGCR